MASIKAIAAIALTLIVAVPILMGYGMASTEATTTSWETDSTTNVTELLYNHNTNYYTTYVGTTNNTELTSGLTPDYVSVTESITSYPAMTTETVSVTFPADTLVSMAAYEKWSFTAPAGGYFTWTIYNDDNTATATAEVFNSGDTVTAHGTISGSAVYVRFSDSTEHTVDVTVYTDEDMYADVTAGWKLPETTDYWENNQTNSEVVFALYLPSGSEVQISGFVITNTDGTVTMTYTPQGITYSYTLGTYSYLWVVLDLEGISVSGLSEWPEYGITPTTYNTVEHTYSSAISDFTSVYLENEDQDAIFRVDSAQILAGTYPTTHNFSFWVDEYYPDVSYRFTIKSVATYGTSLNVVKYDEDGTTTGSSMSVTDGTVTVDGTTMKVRGLEITVLLNSDGTYDAYVGDELVWEDAYRIYIDIWGYWSLTASLDVLTETTSTQQTWAPGEFAFDKEDFAACGLLVAGACLVGLGMTGSRSGAKMGILLMICGGAGLIYLTLI